MTNISAVIVVKDNPPHLFETIQSIDDFVNEIVIVDIGMDADTARALQKITKVKIKKIKEEILYVEQIRQDSISFAKNNYILILDPDEIVPDTLKKYLLNEYTKYDFIAMPRKNIIFNKWIQHSRWWPDYQIRLFKKGFISWEKKLHAQPETKGHGLTVEPVEELALIHYNYDSLDDYILKAIRYSKADAKSNPLDLQNALRTALSEFMSRFYLEEGYKDNFHGLFLSMLQMMYPLFVLYYSMENKKFPEIAEKELVKEMHDFFWKGLKENNHWMVEKKLIQGGKKYKLKLMNKFI